MIKTNPRIGFHILRLEKCPALQIRLMRISAVMRWLSVGLLISVASICLAAESNPVLSVGQRIELRLLGSASMAVVVASNRSLILAEVAPLVETTKEGIMQSAYCQFVLIKQDSFEEGDGIPIVYEGIIMYPDECLIEEIITPFRNLEVSQGYLNSRFFFSQAAVDRLGVEFIQPIDVFQKSSTTGIVPLRANGFGAIWDRVLVLDSHDLNYHSGTKDRYGQIGKGWIIAHSATGSVVSCQVTGQNATYDNVKGFQLELLEKFDVDQSGLFKQKE